MSENQPPNSIEDLSVFNPANFIDTTSSSGGGGGGGITQSFADARYLIKVSPDTAIAEETFSVGVKTDSINSMGNSLAIGATGIYVGSTGSNIYIGSNVQINGSTGLSVSTTQSTISGNTFTVNSGNFIVGSTGINIGSGALTINGSGISLGNSGSSNISIGNASSNITLYGNTTYVNVTNLEVDDANILVNKNGITPLNAGLQVESSGSIVSSLLNDSTGDWVISSTNNKIYVDEISEKTVGHDVVFGSGISMNGQTLDMTGGEIHNCSLIHGQNNNSITIEGKGTGDIYLKTNNLNRVGIYDTGEVQLLGGDLNMTSRSINNVNTITATNGNITNGTITNGNITNGNITTVNTELVRGATGSNVVIEGRGTGDIVLKTNNVNSVVIDDTSKATFSGIISGSTVNATTFGSATNSTVNYVHNDIIKMQQTSTQFSVLYNNDTGGAGSGAFTCLGGGSFSKKIFSGTDITAVGTLTTNNDTVTATASNLKIKSTTGSGTVQQVLNFDTHSNQRGGGILFSNSADANTKQFFGRGYNGGNPIDKLVYNTTTTGLDVFQNGATGVNKFALHDTGAIDVFGDISMQNSGVTGAINWPNGDNINRDTNVSNGLNIDTTKLQVRNVAGTYTGFAVKQPTSNINGVNIDNNGKMGINSLTPLRYLDVNGNAQITDTTASTSTTTGALLVSGGVGVAGDLYVGATGVHLPNDGQKLEFYGTGNNITKKIGSGIEVNTTVFRVRDITETNSVFSVTTGGGAVNGINVSSAGQLAVNKTSADSGKYLDVNGASQITQLNVTTGTGSTGTTSGALVVTGGVGVGGNINSGATIAGLTGSFSNGLIAGNTATTNTLSGKTVIPSNTSVNNKLIVGTEPTINIPEGAPLQIQNITTIDSTVNGSLAGSVYPQHCFGSRNWNWAQDTSNDMTMFLGCAGGGAPDCDYEYYFKRGVGLQIQPNPSGNTTDFTDALSVKGTINSTGTIRTGNTGNTSITNASIMTAGGIGVTGSAFIGGRVNSSDLSVNTNTIYTSGGKVGINETTLADTLNINGTVYSTGTIRTNTQLRTASSSDATYFNDSNASIYTTGGIASNLFMASQGLYLGGNGSESCIISLGDQYPNTGTGVIFNPQKQRYYEFYGGVDLPAGVATPLFRITNTSVANTFYHLNIRVEGMAYANNATNMANKWMRYTWQFYKVGTGTWVFTQGDGGATIVGNNTASFTFGTVTTALASSTATGFTFNFTQAMTGVPTNLSIFFKFMVHSASYGAGASYSADPNFITSIIMG